MIALAFLCQVAEAGGFIQVGTGLRPISLPGSNIIVGGGVRLGSSIGRVTPFVGGTFQWTDFSETVLPPNQTTPDTTTDVGTAQTTTMTEEEPQSEVTRASATNWSLMAGLRVDFTGPDSAAQPFLSAGALMGAVRVNVDDPSDSNAGGTLDIGPGLFAGLGADAALGRVVRVGVEVGLAGSTGDGFVTDGDDSDRVQGMMIWSYADLHLVFRPRKRQ